MKFIPEVKHYQVVVVGEGKSQSHVLYNSHNQVVASGMSYRQAHDLCEIMEKAYIHLTNKGTNP